MKKNWNPLHGIRKINRWVDSQHWLIQLIFMLSMVFIIRTFVFGLYWVPTGSMEPTMLVGEGFFADKLTPLFTSIKRGDIVSLNDPTYRYSDNTLTRLFQMYVYGPQNWTKRVIAGPGEHVRGQIIDGKPVIFVNGERLEEPYVNPYPVVHVQEIAYQLVLHPPFFVKQVNTRFRTFDPSLPITSNKQPFYRITPDQILPHVDYPFILYPYTPAYTCRVSDVFDIHLEKDEYFVMGDNRLASFDSRGFGRIHRSLIHGRIIFRLFSFDTPNSLLYELCTHPLEFFKKARSWDRWFSRII